VLIPKTVVVRAEDGPHGLLLADKTNRRRSAMDAGTEISIARLLAETEAAHGDYEATALGGGRDEDWPVWYATYLLEHGLPDFLPHAENLGAVRLGAILKQLDADYRREQPGSEWPTYYAERLGAMVG
jgi:hypothetical protein